MKPQVLWSPERRVAAAALLFATVTLLLQGWRLQVLTASYDQGIHLQMLWNGLRGHPFESTLSSQLSSAVIHGNQLPQIGYLRLGQHFTPLLVCLIPFYGLLGAGVLPLAQVGLVVAAGMALHALARDRLPPDLASWIAISFFGANAVIGPTLGNFTDLCLLPPLVFLLLLGLQRRARWWIGLGTLLIPLVREDTGVVLMAIGLWLAVRERDRWPLALLMIAWGGGWVALVTSWVMPQLSEDNARRFMVENFGQYIAGGEKASSLQVLREVLRQPLLLLRELVHPPGQTLRYLAGQALPLMFVPLISADSWLLMGLPMLGLLLARGSNNPLSINIRYTYLVVPGLFAGAALWWERHQQLFQARRLRRVWAGCILLSLLFTLTSNPNRSLSFLIPDSLAPWLHTSPVAQWRHAAAAREALKVIPPGASVAASTHLIPLLAQRKVVVRFPESLSYRDRSGSAHPVQWVAVDRGRVERYAIAFQEDRDVLERIDDRFLSLGDSYELRERRDGVLIFQRRG